MTDEHKMSPSAFERTEQLVDQVGLRVGRWTGRVVRRMQHTARSLSQEAKHMEPGAEHRQGPGARPPMQRAEELVDHLGRRINHWTQGGNMRLRRVAARLREDMEDMWVEARSVQHHLHEKPRTEIHEETQEKGH